MKNKLTKIISGFTLIETLVAVSIFSLSILGLLSTLADGISDISYAKQKIVATYLAQEGVESIRNMRDNYILYDEAVSSNWSSFKAALAPCNSGNECGFDNSVDKSNNAFIFTCASNLAGCKSYIDSNGHYNSNALGNDSGFSRKIFADNASAGEIKIHATVSWTQGSGDHSITFSENLFNWTE